MSGGPEETDRTNSSATLSLSRLHVRSSVVNAFAPEKPNSSLTLATKTTEACRVSKVDKSSSAATIDAIPPLTSHAPLPNN